MAQYFMPENEIFIWLNFAGCEIYRVYRTCALTICIYIYLLVVGSMFVSAFE